MDGLGGIEMRQTVAGVDAVEATAKNLDRGCVPYLQRPIFIQFDVRVCVHARLCVIVRARARARSCVCVRACVCARVCVYERESVCVMSESGRDESRKTVGQRRHVVSLHQHFSYVRHDSDD